MGMEEAELVYIQPQSTQKSKQNDKDKTHT